MPWVEILPGLEGGENWKIRKSLQIIHPIYAGMPSREIMIRGAANCIVQPILLGSPYASFATRKQLIYLL